MTICNKCKWLWKRVDRFYCNSGNNEAYSKNKKECKYFEEGKNVRNYCSKNNKYR